MRSQAFTLGDPVMSETLNHIPFIILRLSSRLLLSSTLFETEITVIEILSKIPHSYLAGSEDFDNVAE